MMFEQFMNAINKPLTPIGKDYVQHLMDRTLRLNDVQTQVIQGLYDELGRDLRQALAASSDHGAMAQAWPRLMASAAEANVQAYTRLAQNAQVFHGESWQMLQAACPLWCGQMMQGVWSTASPPEKAKGGRQGTA